MKRTAQSNAGMFAPANDWLANCGSAVAALALAWAASVWCILTTRPRQTRSAQTRQQVPLPVALWHTLSLTLAPPAAATLLPLHLVASLTSTWWSLRALVKRMHLTPARLRGNWSQELRPLPRIPSCVARATNGRPHHSSKHGGLPLATLTRRVRAAGGSAGRGGDVAPHRRRAYPAAVSARAKARRARSWTRANGRGACELCSSMTRRRGVLQTRESVARSQANPSTSSQASLGASSRFTRASRTSARATWASAVRVAGVLPTHSAPVQVAGVLLTHSARAWNVGVPVLVGVPKEDLETRCCCRPSLAASSPNVQAHRD